MGVAVLEDSCGKAATLEVSTTAITSKGIAIDNFVLVFIFSEHEKEYFLVAELLYVSTGSNRRPSVAMSSDVGL
jgi:hypothetical protein